MPFNGNGTFVRGYSWTLDAAQNILILPNRVDADTNDIAAALSNCITRDGQGGPAANISWAGFQINNLGAPTSALDAVNKTYADAIAAAVVTATGNRSMAGFQLNNVGAPALPGDAATKAYVDAVIPTTLTTQSVQLAALAALIS